MTAYAVVTGTITDPDAMQAYRAEAGAALAKHGAKPLQATTEPDLLEGDAPAPGLIVVLEFPDRAAAMAWKNDPDLAETHALRQKAAGTTIVLL